MSEPEYLLIIANSGRMLAQAAVEAGFKPLVIDLYADLDTQKYATDYQQVSDLSLSNLEPVIAEFIRQYAVTAVVYGSGFEQYPASLAYLMQKFTVWGNSTDSFVKTQDKPEFFNVLTQLDIPYPTVSFNPPVKDEHDWLIKPLQGQGGLGISHYSPNDTNKTGVYWQQFILGAAHSVLFLANCQSAQIIGFNTQWVDHTHNIEPFIFSGVINKTDLSDAQQKVVVQWLQKLVPVFSLKGLNSLDFIATEHALYVLEINPRPSASMQLYDADLLTRHINSCRGELSPLPTEAHYTAYQIVYAPYDLNIPEAFKWPEDCADLPKVGVTCRKGQPICSIIAHHEQAHLLKDALKIKQHNLIKGLNSYGIPSKC